MSDVEDTPRPARLRKRLSDAHEVSFGDSPPRPQRSTINDDEAEKRRRRKSTKIAIVDEPGPSAPPQERDASDTSRTARQKQPLNSVAAPVVDPPPALEILDYKFDEWMKMATDNKITAQNSWQTLLIDYFHDMSLLRNVDGDTINFQRASCTLDGCVKVWTSRVDSVQTDTGKLLSNLANDGKEDGEDEGNGSDNPDDETAATKKKKTHRSGATLAKDPAQLRSKKPDLEFSVDPLFKKTSADFDEGGAQGLLMNHLSLGTGKSGCLRIIFDASDSAVRAEDVEDEDMNEPEELVDLTELRTLLPDLDALDDKEISHSLADFSFSKPFVTEDTTFFQDNTQHFDTVDDDEDEASPAEFHMDVDGEGPPPVEDFFMADDGPQDDFGGDMMGGDDFGAGPASNGSGLSAEHGPGGRAGTVPFDPRRPPNELVMAMTDGTGDGGMMDLFDKNFSKNWAGPEHWKMRRVMVRKPDAEGKSGAKPRREKKEAFKLDFAASADADIKALTKELFAPVTRGAGINLPGTGAAARKSKKKVKEKKDDHCLPDDMHFSSRQLVSLFLKPKFRLKMRGRNVKYNEDGDGEVDQNYWVQAAADQAAGRQGDDDDDNGGGMPFSNTQFFHDDYDDGPGFDDGEEDREDTMDVDGADTPALVDDGPPPTDPSEARVFSSVISGLQKSYPKDRMEEISTSFCFICLLHLANEQGLKIDSGMGELPAADTDVDKKIGNIWDLKIFRDPNATQSA
uniref:Condensin complex subunit 2 n=1 Tax=Mycena chlorophos TaxID=658473 RepID=A0ABQ0KVL5_MYCCL|nr:predicted protein [Mycena chlorophos]